MSPVGRRRPRRRRRLTESARCLILPLFLFPHYYANYQHPTINIDKLQVDGLREF